jgi:hypothetical protein
MIRATWIKNKRVYFGLPKCDFEFWVEAIGSRGMYSAGKTPAFEAYNNSSYEKGSKGSYPTSEGSASEILRTLVRELTRAGWEPVTEKGDIWYQYKFRRREK